MIEILQSQIADPLRIGLLIALIIVTARTARQTGIWLPLAAGVLFVAVIIPVTRAAPGGGMPRDIGLGLLANLGILAVIVAVHAVWRRSRR